MFPDAIDLIVRALRSGLPVSEAIVGAGHEIADPVGAELRLVEGGMRMGRDLESLLWDTAKRIDAPEFRFFVIALSVQRETGGNLAETLANLSDVLRRRRQMQAKAHAMASETRATTMILGGLPVAVILVLTLTSPAYLAPLYHRCPRADPRRDRDGDADDRRRDHEQDGEVRDMRASGFQIADWLPAGVSPDDAITVLAGLAVLATVLAMWQVLRPSNAFERRLDDIVQRKENLRQGALAARRGRQRTTAVGVMREAVTRLNLLRSKHAADGAQDAGPGRDPVARRDGRLPLCAGHPAVPVRHCAARRQQCVSPAADSARSSGSCRRWWGF